MGFDWMKYDICESHKKQVFHPFWDCVPLMAITKTGDELSNLVFIDTADTLCERFSNQFCEILDLLFSSL